MKDYIVGLDVSITSTGMSIFNMKTGQYKFFNFPGHQEGSSLSLSKNTKLIVNNPDIFDDVTIVPYTRYMQAKKDTPGYDYIVEQRLKMQETINLTSAIVKTIKDNCDSDNIAIAIEGFSYGSQSSSYIDLIMYQSVARAVFVSTFGQDSLNILSPSENKKYFSGKGNADKKAMINAFINQYVKNDYVLGSGLYRYMKQEYSDDWKDVKPFDDIIDSFALVTTIIMKMSGIKPEEPEKSKKKATNKKKKTS